MKRVQQTTLQGLAFFLGYTPVRGRSRKGKTDTYDRWATIRVGLLSALAAAAATFFEQLTSIPIGDHQWLVVLLLSAAAEYFRRLNRDNPPGNEPDNSSGMDQGWSSLSE